MTLDTSGPAYVAVAVARPPDDVGRPSETLHERPDLGALEALLADPTAVSSEEPAPAGLFTELPAHDETAADGDAPLESRLDDFTVDSAPALPIHSPDAETPAVPMGHGTRGAEPATRDETALADAGEGDSSRADADPDASRAASAAGDIVEQGPSAEDASAEGTSIMASPCTAEPETAADPSGCDRGVGADGRDRVAAAMNAGSAAFLDDALLRDIAETPSVSSESISADRSGATGFAVEPQFRDSRPEVGADASHGRELEPLLDTAPTDPDASEARATLVEAAEQRQATGPETGRPTGNVHLDEAPAAPRGMNSAGVADGAARADDDLFAHASGPDEAEAWTTPVTQERPVERDEPSPEAPLLSVSAAPGAGSDTARTRIDENSVAPASADAVVAEGVVGAGDTSDASGPGVPASAEPGMSSDRPGSERRGAGNEPATEHPDQTAAASIANDAAILDDTLLRDISEAPSVSSDSISSDQSDAADLAEVPPARDIRPAVGAGAPRDEASAWSETPGSNADLPVAQAERDELPLPVGPADGSDDGIIGDDAGPIARPADPSSPLPSGTASVHDESLLRQIADVVAASAGESVETSAPDSLVTGALVTRDAATAPESKDRAEPDSADSMDAGGITPTGSGTSEAEIDRVGHERPGARSDSKEELSPLPESAEPVSGLPGGRRDPGAPADAAAIEDAGEENTEQCSGSVIHLPDLSGTAPSRTEADQGESLLQQNTDSVAASSGEPADVGALRFPGSVDAAAPGAASVREHREQAAPEDTRSEATSAVARPSSEDRVASVDPLAPEHLDTSSDSLAGTPSLHEPAAPEVEAPIDGTGLDETAAIPATEDDVSRDAQTEVGAGPVIGLPDPDGPAPSGADAGHDRMLLRQITDAVAAASGGPAESSEPSSPVFEDAQAGEPEVAGTSAPDVAPPGDASVDSHSVPGRTEIAADPAEDEGDGQREEPESARKDESEASAAAPGIEFDDTLLLDLAGVAPVSSDGDDAPEALPAAPGAPPSSAPEPAFDVSLPDAGINPSRGPGSEPDDGYADAPLEAASPGPAAVLAFATDADTEMALRDGLLGFGSASAGTGEPQVWQGGLRAAIAALAEGRTAPLVIVDIDGVAYPAGAIHELAAVCEVGTVVVAVGSDVSARPGRELLLSGVSDYLAKPLTAEAVHGVASRALAEAAGSRPGGRVACFVGCGGSGATTLAVATALQAVSRGCYVSVLDLSRSVAAAALALGVEPVAGLDQLLETADKVEVEPDSLEGVCGRRMDRIEVYAHRWSPEHPVIPSAAGMDRLLAALRQRSQLVLVDGLDEAETRFISSAEFDTRVFVAEPTADNAPRLARMMDLLNGDWPLAFVQNHTRSFRRDAGARALRDLGLGMEPDLTVPYDPTVPETADRGWPQGKLPRPLRKPVSALTDRLLDGSSGADAAAAFARAA